jgi:hypothetical protein
VRVLPEEERRRLLPILLQLLRVPSIASNSCNPSPGTDTTINCSRTAVSCSRTVVECINLVEWLSTDFGFEPAVKLDIRAMPGLVHRRHPSRKSQSSYWLEPFFTQ